MYNIRVCKATVRNFWGSRSFYDEKIIECEITPDKHELAHILLSSRSPLRFDAWRLPTYNEWDVQFAHEELIREHFEIYLIVDHPSDIVNGWKSYESGIRAVIAKYGFVPEFQKKQIIRGIEYVVLGESSRYWIVKKDDEVKVLAKC